MGNELTCDLAAEYNRRLKKSPLEGPTEIYVRTTGPDGTQVVVDILLLDAPSLLRWLRCRGGRNEFAERTVGLLLGHKPHITDHADKEGSEPT